MARPRKFPNVIHVTSEKDNNEPAWLMVRSGGVFDIDEDDKEVAIYKLVSVGKISINKRYIEKKKVK